VVEPLRTGDVFPKIVRVCPECHSTDTTVTVACTTGIYFRCSACGHVWNQDRVLLH